MIWPGPAEDVSHVRPSRPAPIIEPMKNIRIRHQRDKEVFLGESGWSLNPAGARLFATPLEAIAFVVQRQIENAELVAEANLRGEVTVPM